MGITDLPDQIAKALKYSLRSRGSFLASLVTAMLVLAVAYDLVYGFAYLRLFDVKDVHYGSAYWAGLVAISVVFPCATGALAFFRARALMRPFAAGSVGIAIAPFEVFSVAPETLGTSSALQSLDIVATQFFQAVQNTLSEYAWARQFDFRFLPPYVRVTTKEKAKTRRAALGATLLVWGVITQRSRQPLEVKLSLQGVVRNYEFSHLSIEEFPIHALQFFTAFEAATMLASAGDIGRARDTLQGSLPLAELVDTRSDGGGACVAQVNDALRRLGTVTSPLPAR